MFLVNGRRRILNNNCTVILNRGLLHSFRRTATTIVEINYLLALVALLLDVVIICNTLKQRWWFYWLSRHVVLLVVDSLKLTWLLLNDHTLFILRVQLRHRLYRVGLDKFARDKSDTRLTSVYQVYFVYKISWVRFFMQNWSFICVRVCIDTKPALVYQRYYNRLIGVLICIF